MSGEMSFWEHLGALRDVLLRISAVVLGVGIAAFCFMPWIFDHIILAPCDGDFILYRALGCIRGDGAWIPDMSAERPFHVEIINIELASQFFIHMSASVWLAFIISFPFVLYQLWGFVSPALYAHEKRNARGAFLFGNLMFYLGMAVGYFIVFPLALRFLADYQLSDRIANTVSLTSYMDAFFMLVLMMGLMFELPLLAWLLGKMGLLKRPFFKRYRKYAAVGILVISGIITPTSDLFTLFVVFIPIYALWEASALLVPKGKDEQRPTTKD
ncbi:MAG: twin-arginine translocase subunit TatC [Clostridium sp.]|nr:twin-arginine translocase subunit TatC [Clostridium sp.]